MKILIDTNILISAALFPDGVASQAYHKAVASSNEAIISDYSIEELNEVFQRKFPSKIGALNNFLVTALAIVHIVSVTDDKEIPVPEIRDPKDLPILQAAIVFQTDVILTGDKDFADVNLTKPKIVTPKEFLNM